MVITLKLFKSQHTHDKTKSKQTVHLLIFSENSNLIPNEALKTYQKLTKTASSLQIITDRSLVHHTSSIN